MVFVPPASSSAAASTPGRSLTGKLTGSLASGAPDLPDHWNLRLPDPETVLRIARSERIPEVLAQLAVNRGHTSADAVQALLAPTLHGLNDPAGLPDMTLAAERLERAAASGVISAFPVLTDNDRYAKYVVGHELAVQFGAGLDDVDFRNLIGVVGSTVAQDDSTAG